MKKLTILLCLSAAAPFTACLGSAEASQGQGRKAAQAVEPGRPRRHGRSSSQLHTRLVEKLSWLHAQGRAPGVTAGLALRDGSVLGLAAGVADRDTGRAMSPDLLLQQGSIGKTYASALAMQLVAERRLSLDVPIARYLGDESWFSRLPNAQQIQVRQLLNHTSGLVRYELDPRFLADLRADPHRRWTPEERLAYLFDRSAPFRAGMGWTYSDTNYIVLGMILERIIGTTYYSELQQRLLGPLCLEHTVPAVNPVIPGLSQGYLGTGADNPFGFGDAILVNGRLILSPQWEWTGGGIASTSEDMARWAKLLYEGSAFPEGLMEQYLDGVATGARGGPEESVETGFRYGLGVFLRSTRHGTAYGHAGYAPGHLSEMLYFPRHRTAVAVQINTTIRGAAGRPLVEFLYELMDVVEEAAR